MRSSRTKRENVLAFGKSHADAQDRLRPHPALIPPAGCNCYACIPSSCSNTPTQPPTSVPLRRLNCRSLPISSSIFSDTSRAVVDVVKRTRSDYVNYCRAQGVGELPHRLRDWGALRNQRSEPHAKRVHSMRWVDWPAALYPYATLWIMLPTCCSLARDATLVVVSPPGDPRRSLTAPKRPLAFAPLS